MKGIKKTLIASAFACAAFNAHAERSPLSFGIKGKVGASSAIINDDAKINNKKLESSFISNPAFSLAAGLFGEYAFTDSIGAGLELLYANQKANLKGAEEKQENSDKNNNNNNGISISTHALSVPMYLSIYLMGREDELGILSLKAGPVFSYQFKANCSANDKKIELTDQKEKELSIFNVGLSAAVNYEFNCGISFEAIYACNFLSTFKNESQTIFENNNVSGLKKLNMQSLGIGVAYNLAPICFS